MKIVSSRGKMKAPSGIVTLKDEVARCQADASYFMSRHVYIESPAGIQQFTPWPCQYDALDTIEEISGLPSMIVHCRQAGISSLCLAYLLHQSVFFPNSTSAILLPRGQQLISMSNSFRDMHANLPTALSMATTRVTPGRIDFTNGSKVLFGLLNTQLQGMKLDNLIMHDAAFVNPNEQHNSFMSNAPAVKPTGKMIITTTPMAPGDFIHDLWKKITAGTIRGNYCKIRYQDTPMAGNYATMKAQLGDAASARELDAEFA